MTSTELETVERQDIEAYCSISDLFGWCYNMYCKEVSYFFAVLSNATLQQHTAAVCSILH